MYCLRRLQEKRAMWQLLLPWLLLEMDTVICHDEAPLESLAAVESTHGRNEGASIESSAFRRDLEKTALTDQNASKFDKHAIPISAEPITLKEQSLSPGKPKFTGEIASTVGLQSVAKELSNKRTGKCPNLDQAKRNASGTIVKQNIKRSHNLILHTKENRPGTTSKSSKIRSESKLLPDFESFSIEEEEGSGGYGTVYKARRKEDGKIVALKYPYPNAPAHLVNNELKMLERFGGQNFIIKYEGSFKSGDSECFVLEHVDHDRPEALKKEIDIFELQWYGYCMFRALASLHKQGIVHRDVKPGNFLFSHKMNKGYLIDFNLASVNGFKSKVLWKQFQFMVFLAVYILNEDLGCY